MTAPGPQRQVQGVELEAIFEWWYNAGERRTLAKTAEQFGLGYRTVQKYADEDDWSGRADALDEEARRIRDKRLAAIIGKHRAAEVETIRALFNLFLQRLHPKLASGEANPYALVPGDISIDDFDRISKLFELKVGGATERIGSENEPMQQADLDEILLAEGAALARIEAQLQPQEVVTDGSTTETGTTEEG